MAASATIAPMNSAAVPVRRSQTIIYFASILAFGLTSAALGPTLQGLADKSQTDLSGISYLFTARSFGMLLGSFFLSRLYDRKRGHTVLAVMLLVMAIMMALVTVAATLFLLIAIMVLLGAAEGALDAGTNTLLTWIHKERVAPYMNALHFFYGVGATLSPIIVAQALQSPRGIAASYLILALLTLLIAPFVFRVASPPIQIAATNSATEKLDYRLVLLVAFFLFLYVGAEVGFGGWIFNYAVKLQISDAQMASYLTAAFWGALTLGRLLSIPLAAKLRPRTILLIDLSGCFLSLLLIFLSPASFTAVAIGTLGIGLSMASIFPTMLTFAGRRMQISGQVMGWFIVGASLGAMFLPWLIGQLFDRLEAHIMTLLIAADLLIALGVFAALFIFSKKGQVVKENL